MKSIKEFIISFFMSAKHRLKNPVIGAFIMAWVAVNWRFIAILFFSSKSIEQKIKNAELHDKILASIQNPATEVPAAWSYLLLAERIETEWVATLPKTYIENASDGSETVSSGEIEAFALPDKLAMAVRIYSEADWAAYQSLKNDNSDEAALKKRRLGSFYSKLISFPAKGGSRLP